MQTSNTTVKNAYQAVQKKLNLYCLRSKTLFFISRLYDVIKLSQTPYFSKTACCDFYWYNYFKRNAKNLTMLKITWKSIWNLIKCSDLHSYFFLFFTTCWLFCYTTAMSIVRFALLQKKTYTVSQKKLLLVGKEVVWLVTSDWRKRLPSAVVYHYYAW